MASKSVETCGTSLHFETISHSGPQLHFAFRFSSGLRFTTTIWYDFSLDELDTKFGSSFMEEIYFHCAMFEMNKLCSLHPSLKFVDLGPWSRFYTQKLDNLWKTVTSHTFGEWRFLNNLPNWKGPEFAADNDSLQGKEKNPAITIEYNDTKCLAFCGGGKDSFVSMKLLESIGESFGSLTYSHSIYGQTESQHKLIDSLLDHCSPVRRHNVRVYDDFLSCPVIKTLPNLSVTSVISAETPSSVFEALPIALQYGYIELCLGHERSANNGNLIWNGENINHQWGKSFEAESLIRSYIKESLVTNITFYSILQPIHDPLMYSILSLNLDGVPFTHSCNVRKPWCLRCPKCCYIWLGYVAFLPNEKVLATFGSNENVLDVEENQLLFIQMLGLDDRVPFECIGQPEEAQLAFALCDAKGIKGKAMDVFKEKVAQKFNASAIIAKYLKVYTTNIGIPERISSKYLAKLEEYSEIAKRNVSETLNLF